MADADELLGHEPCPECDSSDACARYGDGHRHCFSCGTHFPPTDKPHKQETTRSVSNKTKDLIDPGEVKEIPKRGISQETCEKWGYTIGRYKGRPVQVANYRNTKGELVGQKLRFPDKDFLFLGSSKAGGLYGQWLWKNGGRKVVVTEGEIDALSVSQLQHNKWPVVSVPTGAEGASRSVREQSDWLENFEEVVFCFDQDDPGQRAAAECAELLTPGRAKIARLPLKDANDMITAGRGKELIDALWQAPVYRPDGIIAGDDLTVDDLTTQPVRGFDVPYPGLNDKLHGMRKGELSLFSAGTGAGKTTLVRELAYHMVTQHGLRVGNIFLEEGYRKTAQGYVAIHNNVPLGNLRYDPSLIDQATYQQTLDEVIRGRMYFYNHFGSLESENLVRKLRYMAVGLGCDFIVLDHISMVVSGQEGTGQGERKDIDVLMTELRSLVENTGVGVMAIVHLKQPEGKAHEEGGQVSLSQLRGSGSLKQIPDSVVALERDQQAADPNTAHIRLLKNREFGITGICGQVAYDPETGRLNHCESSVSDESAGFEYESSGEDAYSTTDF